MLRHLLLLLLLLSYLGGIGAGLVGRPEAPGPTAAHPYVHSAACQHENYLRLDCFDTCNGDQSAVQAQTRRTTTAQLLAAAKSIDLHCLSEMPLRLQTARFRQVVLYQPATEPAVAAGIRLIPEQPPRRG
ncbi:hypothetical protein [Hymenobacter actinosclerus]|uniref:Uncharacterized protein n=1 Tax=Hymenobacter actinosclerus TaxID=82805 RepID=A0A1I0A271_9BACT|nr:hypothetical protein [Hymenobacter actinosclerus]SES88160.1 hypothetical protein SAMN04487998_0560 [Hymenobacter actinosclerus]